MSRFTLKCDNEGIINTLEFDCDYLPDVLNNIEIFLMGCGYAVDYNSLQIMEVETIETTPDYFIKGESCLAE